MKYNNLAVSNKIKNKFIENLPNKIIHKVEIQTKTTLCVLIIFISIMPLWLGRPSMFQDWPNHIARIQILDDILRGGRFWLEFYEFRGFFVPNSLADIGITSLLRSGIKFPYAEVIFLIMGFLIFTAGFCICASAGGAFDASKLIFASVFFYSGPMIYGLVNFYVGVGISMAGIGIFIIQKNKINRTITSLIIVTILFFCHIVSALVFAGVVSLFSILRPLARRRYASDTSAPWVGALLALATPALLVCLLLLSPTAADVLPGTNEARIVYAGGGSLQTFLYWKMTLLPKAFLDGMGVPAGAALLCGIMLFFALAALGGSLHLPLNLAVICAAAVVAVVVLPQRVGTGSLFDYRVAPIPLLLLFAWVRVEWRSQRLAIAAFVVISLVAGFRGASLTAAALRTNDIVRQFDADAAKIPSKSVLFLGMGRDIRAIGWREYWDAPISYLGTRAVSHGVLVPAVYAAEAQQPLVLKPAFARMVDGNVAPTMQAAMPIVNAACTTVRDDGLQHVVLFVSYPSAESDTLLSGYRLIGRHEKYRLVQIC
jgi:hypothetical protein